MYSVSKRMEIAGSHQLNLDYESKCRNLHGHNWIVVVHCRAMELNRNGMVVDFTQIKRLVHDRLDHQNLNELFDFNPTAENIAKWICDIVNRVLDPGAMCYKVEVQESEGNVATYEL